jgi:hypothetical protein
VLSGPVKITRFRFAPLESQAMGEAAHDVGTCRQTLVIDPGKYRVILSESEGSGRSPC